MAADGRRGPVVAKPTRPLKYRDLGPQSFDHVLQSGVPGQFNQRTMKSAIDLEKRRMSFQLLRLGLSRGQSRLTQVEIDLRAPQKVRSEPRRGLSKSHGFQGRP